jgi:hypothetical protein
MVYSVQSQQQMAKLLTNIQLPSTNVTTPPAVTTDQQILDAKLKIADANRRISGLKSNIFAHANNARELIRAGQALEQVEALVTDIAANSQKVADSHGELEAQLIQMEALYVQKVEELREHYSATQSNPLGLSFWVGIVGIIGSFSAMIIAWRKDHRDLIRLRRETEADAA